MKKTRDWIRTGNLVIGIIIGFCICATGVIATNTLFASNEVVYDNSSSGATSSTVQGALDELYELAKDTTIPTITFDPMPTDTCNTEDYTVNIKAEDNIGITSMLYCKATGKNNICIPNIPVEITGTDISIDTEEYHTICVLASDTSGNIITKCSNENGKYYGLNKTAPVITVDGTVNSEVAGIYEVTYTVTDCAGHTTSLVLTVEVISYKDGTPVYFNPETGEMCTDYTESQSTGTSNTGCLKWYIFNDNGSDTTVNMLLDHNIANSIKWNSSNVSRNGPSTAEGELLDSLKTTTANWTSVADRTDTYIDPAKNYTIDYTGYKARLIEANEVWEITKSTNGQANWDSKTSTSTFYFEGSVLSGQGTSKYPWLYDYTRDCTSYGCNVANSSTYGYWTSSARYGSSSFAWYVSDHGTLARNEVSSSTGVRPVITIDKALIDSVTSSINYNVTGDVTKKELTISYSGYSSSATYLYCLSTTGRECTPTIIGTGTSMKLTFQKNGNYRVCTNVIDGERIDYQCSENYTIGEYAVGNIVYFNPESGTTCTDYTESQSTGTINTGCLKWYIINSDINNVDVLLDHNIAISVPWHNNLDNTNGPSTAEGKLLGVLKETTANWIGVPMRTDIYDDPTGLYDIDYSEYRARLIEANEVWKITKSTNGQANWNSATSSDLYFEEIQLSGQGTSKYPWLYDYINGCTSYGCNVVDSNAHGYWTSSAQAYYMAWYVENDGSLKETLPFMSYGIRPVITIPKSQL